MRLFRSHEEREAIDDAEVAYRALVEELRADPSTLACLAEALRALAAAGHREHLAKHEAEQFRSELITTVAGIVLADDHLTAAEEMALTAALGELGYTDANAETVAPGLMNRLVVARANDGRLPVLASHHLLTRPSEVVHVEVPASLVRSVAVREYQGGSRGVSFRIARGVSYRVGRQRGRIVTVGSELQTVDVGTFSVTSIRIVFAGQARNLVFLLKNLTTLEEYDDGLLLGVSNRQTTSLFQLAPVDPVAAVIHAAVNAEST